MHDSNTLCAAPIASAGPSAALSVGHGRDELSDRLAQRALVGPAGRRNSAAWLKLCSCISSSRACLVERLQAHRAAPRVEQAAGVLG